MTGLGNEVAARRLGELGAEGASPTLLVVSSIHGNEPAGYLGSLRVLRALEERQDLIGGHVAFLVGNVRALREGVRYVDRDLNRAWTEDRIAQLRGGTEAAQHEDVEQRELLEEIEGVLAHGQAPAYLLDLHTTSGAGGPFTAVADTLSNRALAMQIPVPLVLGLEELVDGTLHDYMGGRGVRTFAFEAGQHDETRAIERAEAAIWIMLAATGVVNESDFHQVGEARKLLRRDTRHLPRVVEMHYRHAVDPDDDYRMSPGYRNFQPVQVGEVLGRDRRGAVLSPQRARILMPLYQSQGSDGFFIVRDFSPFWLTVSRALRVLGVQRWIHLAPGIRRHPDRPDAWVINRRVARWYALQLMHLLGFRKIEAVGDVLVVLERPNGH